MILQFGNKKIKLPDFFIVGAGKSGTTSLAKYLSEHPQIFIPKVKELHFFAFANEKPSYYKEHILGPVLITDINEYCKYFDKVKQEVVLGEASVTYLYYDLVDNVIKNINTYYGEKKQDLKIIIILRDPVERAFSQYKTRLLQKETLPFVEACKKWEERKKNNWSIAYDYLGFSFYYNSIKKYIEAFGRDKLKIYLFEDLKEKPIELLKDIFRFLGVDENFIPKNVGKVYNKSYSPKNILLQKKIFLNPSIIKMLDTITPKCMKSNYKSFIDLLLDKNRRDEKMELTREVRRELLKIFKEDILKLQDLIGRDLSHWLKVD